MTILILGLILFFSAHLYSTFRNRTPGADIKERVGAKRYMLSYSLISALGLLLIIWGYSQAERDAFLIQPSASMRDITVAAMLPALILIVAADFPKGYIKQWVKHPMLLAVILWSTVHLLDGADWRQLLLFGSFLAFSVINLIAVSLRPNRVDPKSKSPHWRNDIAIVIIGSGLYFAIGHWLHLWLIGVDIFW